MSDIDINLINQHFLLNMIGLIIIVVLLTLINIQFLHNLSLNNRVLVSFDLDFNVGDSKLIFVIDDISSTAFNHYKSLQRDVKIDDILK